MTLLEEVSKITEKIELLHINDPKIMDYWDEMASLLITSEAETIKLIDNLDDQRKVDDISSVFEEISSGLQSKEFIKCIERLERRFPDLLLTHREHPILAEIKHYSRKLIAK